MRWLLAALLLLPAAVQAQFAGYPCVPGLYGTTLDVAAPKRYDAGWRLAWLCEVGGAVRINTLACVHGTCVESTLRNAYMAASTAADPRQAVNAALAQNLTAGSCDTATGALKTICDQARADGQALAKAYLARASAPPAPPPPTASWKVAPNGIYTTRPTYAWANGARSSMAAAERADVGAACDPAVGAGSYRGVLGRTDRVAYCVEVKS